MDEIDLLILRKLLENSRVTYRELAEMIAEEIAKKVDELFVSE